MTVTMKANRIDAFGGLGSREPTAADRRDCRTRSSRPRRRPSRSTSVRPLTGTTVSAGCGMQRIPPTLLGDNQNCMATRRTATLPQAKSNASSKRLLTGALLGSCGTSRSPLRNSQNVRHCSRARQVGQTSRRGGLARGNWLADGRRSRALTATIGRRTSAISTACSTYSHPGQTRRLSRTSMTPGAAQTAPSAWSRAAQESTVPSKVTVPLATATRIDSLSISALLFRALSIRCLMSVGCV